MYDPGVQKYIINEEYAHLYKIHRNSISLNADMKLQVQSGGG